MHAEPLSRIPGAVDAPAARAEDFLDVRALNRAESRRVGGSNRRVDGRFDVVVEQHQCLVGRVNQRTFDDILELADVAGPGVPLESVHELQAALARSGGAWHADACG